MYRLRRRLAVSGRLATVGGLLLEVAQPAPPGSAPGSPRDADRLHAHPPPGRSAATRPLNGNPPLPLVRHRSAPTAHRGRASRAAILRPHPGLSPIVQATGRRLLMRAFAPT